MIVPSKRKPYLQITAKLIPNNSEQFPKKKCEIRSIVIDKIYESNTVGIGKCVTKGNIAKSKQNAASE